MHYIWIFVHQLLMLNVSKETNDNFRFLYFKKKFNYNNLSTSEDKKGKDVMSKNG